jgi:putative phage-type endonuclease
MSNVECGFESESEEEDYSSDTSSDSDDDVPFLAYIDDMEICEHIEAGVDDLVRDYVAADPGAFLKAKYYEALVADVTELACDAGAQIGVDVSRAAMEAYVDARARDIFGASVYPLREMFGAPEARPLSPAKTAVAIAAIVEAPQPAQRSAEWYEFRHRTMLTASTMAKVFGTEAARNSLIYEKCAPLNISRFPVNVANPMHHGVKYEAASLMMYETIYNVSVAEFGCVRHPRHPYIGASPDGIVTDPTSPRFGRMVEIKNIVNRDITGVPSAAYWVQMQFQMEVCGLRECDFVETRFVEYASREACVANTDRRWRGAVLHFVAIGDDSYTPRYVFTPPDADMDSNQYIDEWMEREVEARADTHELFGDAYWYNDEFSCVLVHRNDAWIRAALPMVAETWATIERERSEGFLHRYPKTKVAGLSATIAAAAAEDVDLGPGLDPDQNEIEYGADIAARRAFTVVRADYDPPDEFSQTAST